MLDQFKQVDPIEGWLLLAVVTVLLIVFELGRWFAHRRARVPVGGVSYASNVLSGMLTLLSFFLAFSFSIASDHFEARRKVVLDEANAIGTTYLRSKYLPEPQAATVQQELLKYVNLRITDQRAKALPIDELHQESAALQTKIWAQAVSLEPLNPDSEFAALFIVSLNEMIDLDEARMTTAFAYRLPMIIIVVLFVISMLTLLVMGYRAGLRENGSALLTCSVVFVVAVVLVLIIDLDRPLQRTFSVDQQALIDVRDSLRQDLAR